MKANFERTSKPKANDEWSLGRKKDKRREHKQLRELKRISHDL